MSDEIVVTIENNWKSSLREDRDGQLAQGNEGPHRCSTAAGAMLFIVNSLFRFRRRREQQVLIVIAEIGERRYRFHRNALDLAVRI
jgi:hypothetical protein